MGPYLVSADEIEDPHNLTRHSRNQTGEAMMPEWALSY
jgi:hypothetical protein